MGDFSQLFSQLMVPDMQGLHIYLCSLQNVFQALIFDTLYSPYFINQPITVDKTCTFFAFFRLSFVCCFVGLCFVCCFVKIYKEEEVLNSSNTSK